MKTTINFIRSVTMICLVCFSLTAFAHERDTLKCHFDPSATFTYMLYHASLGGYTCGTNGWGDLEIAQKFGQAPVGDTVGTECAVGDEHQLNEVLVYFGAKHVSNPNDSVYLKVYGINHATGAPGVLLGTSFPVTMNFIDTSVTSPIYTTFLIQLPVVFTDSFFISAVFPGGTGDTVGVISSSNGDAQGSKLCWMKSSSGTWSALLDAHSLDADAVIFPIIGDVTIGIPELNPLITSVSVFPNPARDNAVIDYSVAKSVQQLKFTIADISGKVVYSLPLIDITAGDHHLNIATNELSSGRYFYSFDADGKKYGGRLDVVK